jgi:hypothetical protein
MTDDKIDGALGDAPVEVTSGTAPLEVAMPNTEVRVTQDGRHPYRLEYRYQDGSEYSGWDYPTRDSAEEAAAQVSLRDATVNVDGREGIT